MKVLLLYVEDGRTVVKEKEEITQEELKMFDESTLDIFRAMPGVGDKGAFILGYDRAAIDKREKDDAIEYFISGWNPL